MPRLCTDVCTYLSSNLVHGNAFEVYEFARTSLEPTNILAVKSMEFVLGNFFSVSFIIAKEKSRRDSRSFTGDRNIC